ncbi:MAG TPA: glycoside hydrolase family 2 TIM barrel-domain containing protein, partial [Calditrichia bacterium]|nr:glycoside hydrolase family 2 TIM barrel-domain containing protein [Calditrichia bacterium]
MALFFGCAGCGSPPPEDISLAGTWRFAIDSTDAGMTEKWFEQSLPQTISLPGSMAENDLGDIPGLTTRWTGTIYDSSWFFDPRLAKYRRPGKVRFPFWLTPRRHYVGPAWYQKTVVIPESWANQALILHLERPHWETTVWVDTHLLGTQNSLSAPNVFELGRDLQPGPHTVTIRVDNRIKDINVGPDSHSLTDHTQGNWNGIAGDIRLETRPDFYIDDVQVYPDIHRQSATVRVTLGNSSGDSIQAAINLSARSFNSPNAHSPAPQTHEFQIFSRDTTLEFTYPLGEGVLLWDEFDPALYRLSVSVSDPTGQSDAKIVQFGMREFAVSGTRFAVNGKTTFLRGTVECAAFPHTGYPPTDVPSWERIFKICREHGLNHMRFHSWCPPEAAFIAADKIGFYLQPEGPSWANHGSSIGDGNPIDQYIFDETERILRAYGNHPSLVMMAYGNEPAGENQVEYLGNYVNHFKAKDPRRLYTGASIARSWPVVPESEFIVRSEPRGLPWNRMPQSRFDYRDKIAPYPVPYVTHEMGQFCVFPDFSEIAQYSGVYQARNFQLFQEDLADHHMGDQARDFLMASGKLQALCYKSEIEAALRTPGSAGIQLLGLNDFPGQGTALVGVLNVFWGEKGYITPGEFRRFCNSTVALARLPKF